MKGTNAAVWAAWSPSFKPPSGTSPVYLIDGQGAPMAAGGTDFLGSIYVSPTSSGVSRCIVGTARGHVYNGVGLMDDLAVSDQIQGTYANSASEETGSWWMAEALNEETSPTYDSDGIIYVTTWSEWTDALSLWRLTTNTPCSATPQWERVMYEELVLPDGHQFEGKAFLTNSRTLFDTLDGVDPEDWWVQVTPTFSADPYVFVLGAIQDFAATDPEGDPDGAITEMFWYSPDKGDTWITFSQMPLGAEQTGEGLSDTGWYVFDNKTFSPAISRAGSTRPPTAAEAGPRAQ
jgi:hypothetical protein